MTTPFYKEGNAMTTPAYIAADDQMMRDDDLVAENGQTGEEVLPPPGRSSALHDSRAPDGAADVDDDAKQALVADEWDADSPSPFMPAGSPC